VAPLPVTLIPKPYNCLYSLRQSRRLSGRVTVVRTSNKTVSPVLQLAVEFVEHEVTEQWRKRTSLRSSFHAIDYLVAPFGEIDLIAGAFNPPPPLCANLATAFLQIGQGRDRDRDLYGVTIKRSVTALSS
jgi:hypothetical protein